MSSNPSRVSSSSNGNQKGAHHGAGLSKARQREMLADLCRFIGAQLTGKPNPVYKSLDLPACLNSGPHLAPRIRQTLERILAGDNEKQAALRLGLSRNTVHVYIRTIYRRYDVCSRSELIARIIGTLDTIDTRHRFNGGM